MDDLKLYSCNEKESDSSVQTIRVLSEDIVMKFEIDKSFIVVIETGKIVKSVGIELPDGKIISHQKKVKIISILEFQRQIDF